MNMMKKSNIRTNKKNKHKYKDEDKLKYIIKN